MLEKPSIDLSNTYNPAAPILDKQDKFRRLIWPVTTLLVGGLATAVGMMACNDGANGERQTGSSLEQRLDEENTGECSNFIRLDDYATLTPVYDNSSFKGFILDDTYFFYKGLASAPRSLDIGLGGEAALNKDGDEFMEGDPAQIRFSLVPQVNKQLNQYSRGN